MRTTMLRRLILIVAVVVLGASWFGPGASVAAAHDVETDVPDMLNRQTAYPFIGNVSGFNKVGGGFEITVHAGGGVKGYWQCAGGSADTTVGQVYSWTNWHGTTDRVLTPTVPDVTSTTFPGAMLPGERCWFYLTAYSLDNAQPVLPFDLRDIYWWGDIPAAGEGNEDPGPTPTPTPGATPTPTPPGFISESGSATCMTNTLRNSRWRNATTTTGRTGPAIAPGDVVVMRLTIDLDLGQTFARDFRWTGSSADEPTAISFSGGNQAIANSGLWYLDGSSTTINAETNGEGTYWQGRTDLGQPERTVTVTDTDTYLYCHASDNNGGTSTYNTYTMTWWINPPGGDINPSPTPTPTPGATPTPIPPGTIQPPPNFSGFDVCSSEYTASEKSMCDEWPDPEFPDTLPVEMCGQPGDEDLALCQPVEPWEGPEGGAGGTEDGTPGGGGSGSAGFGECPPTPIESKVGYAAPDDVPDVDDLSARVDGKDPLAGLGESIGWLGDMVWTLPNRIGNGLKWVWNQGVNSVVPGECLDEKLEARWMEINEHPPFSIFYDVSEAVEATAGSASAESIPTMPLPGGGTFVFPLDDIESGVAPYRGAMGAAVWLFGAIAAMRIVAGSFGVGRGRSEDDG